MDKLGLNEIRERYLSFFESKGHLRLPSFSLVPKNDASLLLINAGMAPLKPYFTGQEKPPKKRVTTCQKCIRTPDIERVGKTARHGTFFEMLGNFSFGDYFKYEAITWAWEFITEKLKMPVDRLWVSIYEDDDEAFNIWNKTIGVSEKRIVRLGKEDNFWEIGVGPCGPCSEIYFDRGEKYGCGSPNCAPGCDCDRFIEFWNLVFTQFNKDKEGNYNPLPNPNIDTGMGLERLATIMQNVDSIFDVDTIRNVMQSVCTIAGVKYNKDKKVDVSLRVITDHIRGTVFLICDGILPSNEGRGYVLRRLIRRAARHGKLLGVNNTFLHEISDTVIDICKDAYPGLNEKREYIKKVIKIEEERFNETIDQGINILNNYILEIKNSHKDELILNGDKAFKLYDTYGFPVDLTKEILAEQGMKVDEKAFDKEMQIQRERARAARSDADEAGWDESIYSKINITNKFVGYSEFKANNCKVLEIVSENKQIDNASKNDNITIILNKTPFYGESGGQVGDTGILANDEVKIKVIDCKKIRKGIILHSCVVEKGKISVNDKVQATIDIKRRKSITRNHSATHLLQKALRNVLGEHVAQSGSLVTSNRLRFDFSHFSAMTNEEIEKVEDEVNKVILEGMNIRISEMPIEEAKKIGAMALFNEKYGEFVRVVKMGDYSIELCGGSHLDNTSKVGAFKIISETGVAAGVRRIEAVTGFEALKYFKHNEKLLCDLSYVLKSNTEGLVKKAKNLMNELKNAQKDIDALKSELAGGKIDEILSKSFEIDGVRIITARIDELDINGLRNVGDKLRDKIKTGLIVLATSNNKKVNFVAMATKDAINKGIHAGNIIREIASIAGGGGGGRPDMAQAGGKDASKIDEALSQVTKLVKQHIK